MRRIVTFNHVSADGYFSALDGSLDWVVPDEDIERAGAASVPDTDMILFGRRTFERFEGFWSRALDNPVTAPDPHQAGRRTATLRAMAVFINDTAKVVFSKTLTHVTWKNTTLRHAFDPAAIAALKSGPGKNIIVFGSGSIASLLTHHRLIDEYQFVVCPTLLGGGRSFLTGVPERLGLDLLEAKAYRSGSVMLRYAPAKATAAKASAAKASAAKASAAKT